MTRFPLSLTLCLAMAGFALADPNPAPFENWKTDFTRHSVDPGEIRSGGPPRDGIPAIDAPVFVAASEAALTDTAPVIALALNGEARAYPLQVLMWHEIANDRIGGEPVTVTYCPLCNAAIVFSGRLDGRELDFGTTGRLRNSDLVMYDRQTESWWQQFSGRAIIGEMTGKRLTMIASTTVPFATFRARYPDGRVLVPNNPDLRDYGRNPYAYYDTGRPFLYSGALPDGIDPMERVVIAETAAGPAIVTLAALREAGEMAISDLVLHWQPGMASALDNPDIARGRDVGHVEVTRRPDGEAVVHHVTFAFVAHAFHPQVPIRKSSG